jgi:transglutaminase-like putative cysteine protease
MRAVSGYATLFCCAALALAAAISPSSTPAVSSGREISLDQFKDIAEIIGVAIALLTLIKAIVEYSQQGAQKRIELYLKVRSKFDDNPTFAEIRRLLDDGDPRIAEFSFKDRSDYASYFEEVALLKNSGVIKPDVAFYMFAWEATQCWQSDDFWQGFDKSDRYWGLLRIFVEEMESISKGFEVRRKEFKF